jgi:hypothetical protein
MKECCGFYLGDGREAESEEFELRDMAIRDMADGDEDIDIEPIDGICVGDIPSGWSFIHISKYGLYRYNGIYDDDDENPVDCNEHGQLIVIGADDML